MSQSKTQPQSLQEQARKVRRRMLKDLLRVGAAQTRAMTERTAKRPRRGPAATERGLFAQQFAEHR